MVEDEQQSSALVQREKPDVEALIKMAEIIMFQRGNRTPEDI